MYFNCISKLSGALNTFAVLCPNKNIENWRKPQFLAFFGSFEPDFGGHVPCVKLSKPHWSTGRVQGTSAQNFS